MRSFQHLEPALRLFHGEESLAALTRELGRLDRHRAVIFCGRTLAADAQLMGLLRHATEGRCAGVFDGVRAHSPLDAVKEGAQALARFQADAVVAVGGGSAIVTARASSILLAEGGDLRSICTQRDAQGRIHSPRLAQPKLPQFVVPTTPTTACVKAGSAVFDPATGKRLALFDPKTRAQGVFVHPGLLLSAPAALVSSASLNAFTMVVEGLESAQSDALSDAALLHSLRLLAAGLPSLADRPDDAELRSELMMAAVLCGQGTDQAGGGLASVLGHAIGARFGIDNGVANAIVLPHTLRFNASHTGERQAMWRPFIDEDAPTAEEAVRGWLNRLHGSTRLRDIGVARGALASIAQEAMDDWFIHRNPRPVEGVAPIVALLEAAW